jgi:hypothetical protein
VCRLPRRRNAPDNDEPVGVGAYFGRIEGQSDNVARVKSLIPGGPAEQVRLRLCSPDTSTPARDQKGPVRLRKDLLFLFFHLLFPDASLLRGKQHEGALRLLRPPPGRGACAGPESGRRRRRV